MKLKAPGSVAVPQIPLMPNQVVFRHKALLPWWIALLVPLLLLLALLLFLFLPRNVTVPEVTGKKSTFEAEKVLVKANLKLAPAPKEKVSTEAPPGTVIGQTPAAGEKAKKDSEVALEIAVGNGKVQVPNVVGQTQVEAEKTLREKGLTIGQLQPQPPDPKAKTSSQIPAADEVVTEGKPIDLFMADIKDKKKKEGGDDKDGGGGGGGKAAAVTLAALAGMPVAEAAQAAADAGLVPVKVTEFSGKKKGELIRTEPGPGTKLAAGAKVKLVVSGGFPKLVYDDGKNVKLVNGANGKPFPAVAKGSQEETDPTFSADGEKIAFLSNRRLFLRDLSKPDDPPVGLTEGGEKFGDPAWAPTVDSNVIAMFKDKSAKGDRSDQDLCFLQVAKEQQAPQCISEPNFNVVKTIRWAPDGKSIFALGTNSAARTQVRHGPVEVEEAVLVRGQGLGQGQVQDRHDGPGEGRHRPRDLAGRQADGGRRQLRRRRLPALPRQAEGLPAHRRQAARRAGVQGQLALGRSRGRGRAGRCGVQQPGQRPDRARAAQEPRRAAASRLLRR